MTLLNPKNLQKIEVLKSYTDPFHKSPCCFLELSLKRTGNRLCVVSLFSLLKLQQICATSDSQTWPHPITKGFTDEAIMVAKTSWWSWISDICYNRRGHWVDSDFKRQIFVRYVRPSRWLLFLTSWNHPRWSFEKLASKASPVQLRFQSKSVWKQGPRRFGSFHHWNVEILWIGGAKTALSSPQPFPVRAVVLSKNPGVLHPSPILKGRGSLVLEVDNFSWNQPITSHPGLVASCLAFSVHESIPGFFSRKMRGCFLFFGGSLWFGFKGM